MAFKVNDLMIDVHDAAQKEVFSTQRCCIRWCTRFFPTKRICLPCTNHSPSWYEQCQGGTREWDDPRTLHDTTTIIEYTHDLGHEEIQPLKEQLKLALEMVDKRELQLNDELRPKTLEEVSMLETKLRSALEVISKQKDELKKK